jgi:RimJ/RimL family protein N-acetyltransferase
VHEPRVKTLRYTVSPENFPSQAIIKKFGFAYCGQQIDEEDGPEDIYEMSADTYRRLKSD